MSRLQNDVVADAVKEVLQHALYGKKRNFLETIEIQISLKNYDPSKDKRFSGTVVLPHIVRPKFRVCVIGNDKVIDECKAKGIEYRSKADLEALKKDKKLVKKLAAQYHAFIASADLVRQIPRLLGPGLNKAGKFPVVLGANEDVTTKVVTLKASVKFQLKSKKTTALSVAVANVGMSQGDIEQNITLALNFLVSLLKKNWQNVRRVYLKSTMGPSHAIFGI